MKILINENLNKIFSAPFVEKWQFQIRTKISKAFSARIYNCFFSLRARVMEGCWCHQPRAMPPRNLQRTKCRHLEHSAIYWPKMAWLLVIPSRSGSNTLYNSCHFHDTEPFRMNHIPNWLYFSNVDFGMKNVNLPHLKNNT